MIILAGFLAGIAGGVVWALLAGMLKFYGGVSEIFAGLGLNFIATALTLWLIFGPWKRAGVASMSGTEPFDMSIWLPTLTGYRLSIWSLLLAVLSVLIVYFILKHTVVGLRLKAVGKNYKAAIQMGISPSKYMLLSFVLCGVFAGLTGAVQVLGVYHRLIPSISSGYGFLGLLCGHAGRLSDSLGCTDGAAFRGAQHWRHSAAHHDEDRFHLVRCHAIFPGAVFHVDGWRQETNTEERGGGRAMNEFLTNMAGVIAAATYR